MVKVLILGATGVIGREVARAFTRNGHEVYGLTRSAAKAKELQQEEINGVVGDTSDSSTWIPYLEKVSVIVDTSFDYSDPAGAATKILNDLTEGIKQYPQRRFIYVGTTGTWVHGSGLGVTVDESLPATPIPIVAWRPALEQRIIQSKDFDGIVIRPGLVSGKNGSIYSNWFSAVEQGQVTLFNDDKTRCAPVHTDDLAETYVNAVERIEQTRGQIFNVSNPQTENVTDIIKAMARAINVEVQITYKAPSNPFEEALGLHSPTFDVRKAVKVLGFEQRRPGVVDGIERYYKSWKACQ